MKKILFILFMFPVLCFGQGKGFMYINPIKYGIRVYETADGFNEVGNIQPNDTAYIIGYTGERWSVVYKNITGYASEVFITQTYPGLKEVTPSLLTAYKARIAAKDKARIADEKAEKSKLQAELRAIERADAAKYAKIRAQQLVKYTKIYGDITAKKIVDRYVWLGMTKQMAIHSWGNPENINKTVTQFGVHEQWVYGSGYLYFDNGKLSSFQTSN